MTPPTGLYKAKSVRDHALGSSQIHEDPRTRSLTYTWRTHSLTPKTTTKVSSLYVLYSMLCKAQRKM